MEFTVKKDSIAAVSYYTESSAEHTVDCDVAMPEYMPDVARVLRCILMPSVASQQVGGDRISAECDCTMRIIYVCDKGKVHSFEQTEHFGKQLAIHSDSQESVKAVVKTEYVNYRVLSGKKIEIHGSVLVSAVSLQKTVVEAVSGAEGDGMTVREEMVKCCTPVFCGVKSISLAETFEVNSIEALASVLCVSSTVRTDEVKAIHGKLFVRGELCVKTACLTEESEVVCFENSVPINQIVDTADANDDSVSDINITVNSVSVRPRSDSSADRGLLEMDADLSLSACIYDISELSVVLDAYSTKYETQADSRAVCINDTCEKLYDTFLCRESVDISASPVKKVYTFTIDTVSSKVSVSDGGVTVSGTVTSDCLFEDMNDEIHYVTRQIPFEYRHPTIYENVTGSSINVNVSAYNYALGTGGSLDVRVELTFGGLVFCGTEKKIVTDISIDKSKCKSVKTASLTIYFAEKDEDVWDIARIYNTTPGAIMRENRLTEPKIAHQCKLLIPKV